MRLFSICFIILLSLGLHAQENIIYITPQQLFQNIKNSDKPTVVQFWVPNCEAANEIVTEFNQLQNSYSTSVDFYFLGLTNKKELVENLVKTIGYNHKIYIIDPSVNNDLIARKETFAKQLCALLGIKQKDFITLTLSNTHKKVYCGDAIDVKKAKLEKIIRL